MFGCFYSFSIVLITGGFVFGSAQIKNTWQQNSHIVAQTKEKVNNFSNHVKDLKAIKPL